MILIDTGPIVALFDASDNHHRLCAETLKEIEEPLVTTWAVLTEAFYLLGFSWKAQDNLWESIIRGSMTIMPLDGKTQMRCRELMEKYNDLPMDLADASLVGIAESLEVAAVFTLDRRDFSIYRPAHTKSFSLIPSSLP